MDIGVKNTDDDSHASSVFFTRFKFPSVLRFPGTKLCEWCEQGTVGSHSFDQFENQMARDDLGGNVSRFSLNGLGKTEQNIAVTRRLPDPTGILLPCISETGNSGNRLCLLCRRVPNACIFDAHL
jgi:hypothetical protein